MTDPEGNAVICKMSVQFSEDDAKPEAEENCMAISETSVVRSVRNGFTLGILHGRETVATHCALGIL